MSLPEKIDAENQQKTLRVLNVTYPLTIENVSKESCGIRIQYIWSIFRYFDEDLPTHVNRKPTESVSFDTGWLYVPSGHYTLDKLLQVLNAYVNEYGMYLTELPSKRVGVTLNIGGVSFLHQYNTGKVVKTKGLKPVGSYIKLDFTKNLQYMLGLDDWVLHPTVAWYKENYFYDNTPPLSPLELITNTVFMKMDGATPESYDPALGTFYGAHLPDMTNGLTRMFVYCDEVVASMVGNVYGKLLAVLKIETGDMGSANLYTYTCPETTVKFTRSQIDKLHIKVCDTNYNLIQFSAGTFGLECVIE
ncbi:Hypothetical predicted protein [Paramuricea clavata]|uniref:Uncharacterized protein n=1 Tax=Paramuricea clavata TaxID=317549 RepID=A0A7D9DD25_PARCT|nr:Hypothetical predicted protein [Paramuricea clavata]